MRLRCRAAIKGAFGTGLIGLRSQFAISICLLNVAVLRAAAALAAVDLYVAPGGWDTNPGTKNQPFASLQRARDALRERKRRERFISGRAAALPNTVA